MHHCKGQAILRIVSKDVEAAAGPLQLCAGQDGGCEAAVHAMRKIFQDPDTVDTYIPLMLLILSTTKLPYTMSMSYAHLLDQVLQIAT